MQVLESELRCVNKNMSKNKKNVLSKERFGFFSFCDSRCNFFFLETHSHSFSFVLLLFVFVFFCFFFLGVLKALSLCC